MSTEVTHNMLDLLSRMRDDTNLKKDLRAELQKGNNHALQLENFLKGYKKKQLIKKNPRESGDEEKQPRKVQCTERQKVTGLIYICCEINDVKIESDIFKNKK